MRRTRSSPARSRKLRILFAAVEDPRDIAIWSGTPFFMLQGLCEIADVEVVAPLQRLPASVAWLLHKGTRVAPKWAPSSDYSRVSARWYASQVGRRMHGAVDAVIAPSPIPTAYLKTDTPCAFANDATIRQMVGMLGGVYPGWAADAQWVEDAEELTRRALDRCSLALFPSAWAVDSVLRDYGTPVERVHRVPFGANIGAGNVPQFRSRVCGKTIKLLFVARHWKGKGGDKVVEVAECLRAAGRDVEVIVCGCTPPSEALSSVPIRAMGWVDKRSPQGLEALTRLYQEAHYFIMPSLAEAYGIVFCEAMAFGLPSLASNVGGIPSVVLDGVNGFTFDREASASLYAEAVLRQTEASYLALSRQARELYESTYNWRSWAAATVALLREVV